MRKYFVLLMMLLAWQSAMADVVTKDQARRRAAEFFAAAEVKTKASAVRPEDFKLVGTFPEVATKSSSSAPAMYIFERTAGGFAVVSGDDVARPVLGYSLSGRFPIKDMPDNVRAMLQWYADVIDYARQQHWAARPTSAADGLDPANTVQLQTAQWNQGSPFNDLVPEIDGEKPPIGCVATAIAIIMRYHKWPQRGSGMLPSYDYTKEGVNYHVDGFELGHEYNWDKMPEHNDYRNYSEEEAAQIARLLYDVAVMCKMAFNLGGSGASVIEGVFLLTEFMGYDKSVRSYGRSRVGFSDLQWESLLSAEIDAGRPALYSGFNVGGHAFVVDGYCGRYFSINFGWGGFTNDFFTVTPIEGHADDLIPYNRTQSVTTHIMPDQGGVPEPVICAISACFLPVDFELGKSFVLTNEVENTSIGSSLLDLQYVLYDANSNVKEAISPVIQVDCPSLSIKRLYAECKVTQSLSDGDRILLSQKDPVTGEWIPLLQPRKAMIIFSEEPLTALTEFCYIEEPQHPDKNDSDKKRDIYLELNKDVLFELWNKGETDVLLAVSGSLTSGASFDNISYYYDMLDGRDPKCETVVYELWLPTGSYSLRLRNPATAETMEINLEL